MKLTIRRCRNMLLLTSLLLMMALCSCTSSNFMVGTAKSGYDLQDQRAAARTVQVFDTVPDGYVSIGPVDAARCHRNFDQKTPSRELVLIDLKVTAYSRGADAIADVTITKKSALLKNCWYMLDGRATMLRRIESK